MRSSVNELLNDLCADAPHIVTAELRQWLNASPRFAAFAASYRAKIRKKIRLTRDAEGFRDLLCELETAYWLLQEPRFSVTYEPYHSEKTRGPDFAVAFRTHVSMNVEVARMRMAEASSSDPQRERHRLIEIVCDKLGQMWPGMANLLLIVADRHTLDEKDVSTAMLLLKERAERQDTSLFTRYRLRNRADFFKFYQRLSGVLLRGAWDQGPRQAPILWINKQARHPLTTHICRILLADNQ